jgi:hypothetical protein
MLGRELYSCLQPVPANSTGKNEATGTPHTMPTFEVTPAAIRHNDCEIKVN